jgi:hypothetical protein
MPNSVPGWRYCLVCLSIVVSGCGGGSSGGQDKWNGTWSGVLEDSLASSASPCYGPSATPVKATLRITAADGFIDVTPEGQDFEQFLSRQWSAHLPLGDSDQFTYSYDVIPPGGSVYDSRAVQFRITGTDTADLEYHAYSGGNGTASYRDCHASMVRQAG